MPAFPNESKITLLLPIIAIAVTLLLVAVAWWWRRNQVMQDKGLTRDAFVNHFRSCGVLDSVSSGVYDHFRDMMGVRGYQPAPFHSIEKTFKMAGDDLDDELEDLLPKLGLELPHSGVLREWNKPIQTLEDVVLWVDWVRRKQDSSGM